jgi:TonB family protein
VTLNGLSFPRSQGDVPPGTYNLAVRAPGYAPFERQVVILPGAPSTVKLELQPAAGDDGSSGRGGGGPCEQYGPAYNQDNLCFDTRPLPLSLTRIPVQADASIFPRQAILLIHVSREGTTLEARVFGPSNLDTFNNEALDMAKNLRWNPAQKNGEPVDAWVQWAFQPMRP